MNLVEFPGLWGLKFTINRVAFEPFGIPIYWYGIIIAFGFLVAVLLGMKNSKLAGLEPDSVLDLVLFAAPVAIICARLFYVIFSWDQFKDNPIDIINTRKGGLAIYGGVLGALVVAYIFGKKKKVGFFKIMDFGAPYLIMGQGIGRWGNFINQEAFGVATSLPWRMNSQTVNAELKALNPGIDLTVYGAHPTFLYESLWDFAVFFFLIWFRKRKKLDGEVFFLYMALYGLGRFFIESLRVDSLYLGTFRISQLLAAAFVVIFAFLFIYRRKTFEKTVEEAEVEIGQSQYGSVLMKLREEEAQEEKNEAEEVKTEEAKAEEINAEAEAGSSEAVDGGKTEEQVPADNNDSDEEAREASEGVENKENNAE